MRLEYDVYPGESFDGIAEYHNWSDCDWPEIVAWSTESLLAPTVILTILAMAPTGGAS